MFVHQHFNIVLVNPVIPQNTGSIARLCACTGAALHLIHPLGFQIDDASVKRAGLDYWPHVDIKDYVDWNSFMEHEAPKNLFLFSKWAEKSFYSEKFSPPVYLVFGSETQGLPEFIKKEYSAKLCKVPMRTNLVRSLNLSQCAAIALYEVIRQNESLENYEHVPQRMPKSPRLS